MISDDQARIVMVNAQFEVLFGYTKQEIVGQSIEILLPEDRVPWSGHSGAYATEQVMDIIARHKTTLIFCNTRGLAELNELATARKRDEAVALLSRLVPEYRPAGALARAAAARGRSAAAS